MLTTPKSRGELFLASSLRDGLEDNDIRQVETLLSIKDADPNVLIPTHGISPFHLVIGNESEKFAETVTKLFLRHGGDPNVRSSDGMTPVHVAAAWGRVGVLELLLANGGDPLCLDDEGRNPFHYAFDGAYYEAIATLGKYCGTSQDDEEEKPKFKLTLEKILINKGNVIAEYVPSDDSYKTSCASSSNEASSSPMTRVNSNCSASGNVTLRRCKKIVSPSSLGSVSGVESAEDEKLLVGRIIRRLSNTLTSDSTVVNDAATIVRRVTKNSRSKNTTRKKPGILPFQNHPKLESKPSPRRRFVPDTSVISKSPNCQITGLNDEKPVNRGKYDRALAQKLSKLPEVRVGSASSTPKKKRYSGRLYELKNPPRKLDKTSNFLVRSRLKKVIPTMSHPRIPDKNEIIVDYSPNMKISTPKKRRNEEYEANDIAIGLDDRFNHENLVVADDFELKPRISDNDGASDDRETEKLHSDLESPGSSNPLSVCSQLRLRDATYDRDEETKILLEIEEACEKRCGTPPASISALDYDEDHPRSAMNFNSDRSCGETSSIGEFYETDRETIVTWSRSESFVSVDEEYMYEDQEEGIAFVERHLRVIPSSRSEDMDRAKEEASWIDRLAELSIVTSEYSSGFSPSSSVIAKSAARYDDQLLRERLRALGEIPGPITKTTFNVYLKRLWMLEHTRERNEKILTNQTPDRNENWTKETERGISGIPSSMEIPESLLSTDWTTRQLYYGNLEEKAFKEYSIANPKRKYRGGISKTSFCYILLDPRITRDLPRCGASLKPADRWARFLRAVFYIGKGKAARPAAHLYDAFGVWSKRRIIANDESRKIRRILDIWEAGKGVVCLHVFSHAMTEEACSREASMIDALGTAHLTNCLSGTYYGYATTMSGKEKRSLGKYLLYKSMEIFMHEGERQIFPRNVIL